MTKVLQPPTWARPRGYANGVMARGQTVCVAGMIGWDAQCQFHTDDFAGQVRQALLNVVAVLSLADIAPAALQLHQFWGSLLLALLLWGPGAWSLDAWMKRRLG